MLKKTFIAFAAALPVLGAVHAQESALLDLMVKKKLITAQEAKDVRADLVREQATTSAGKIAVGSWVQEMKIGGDLRLRYQYDNRDFQVDPAGSGTDKDRSPSGSQRSRFRFRLRLNDEFKLTDNWFGGVQLQTSPAADSGNQTLGNGFGKYSIFISRAFLGWAATGDWLTLQGGKIPNPFYTTELVWDPDINPDGFAQTIRFDKMHFGGSDAGSYSKDAKSFIASEIHEERPWELALTLGEFIFNDNIENGGIIAEPGLRDNDVADDAWLFEAQLLASYKVVPSVKITVAPGFMFYNAASLSSLPSGTNENQFSGVAARVLPSGDLSFLGETRNLAILVAPGDVNFKLGSVATKFYWDFAWNTRGRRRAEEIYGLLRSPGPAGTVGHLPTDAPGNFGTAHHGDDDFAWLVGVQFGQNKKKGDLSANVNWRQTGITSVDPNLNDSDFANSELNTRGLKAGLTYNLTDFATIGATYLYAWNLHDNLVGGAATTSLFGGPNSGGGIADSNVVQVLQVDLNLKF